MQIFLLLKVQNRHRKPLHSLTPHLQRSLIAGHISVLFCFAFFFTLGATSSVDTSLITHIQQALRETCILREVRIAISPARRAESACNPRSYGRASFGGSGPLFFLLFNLKKLLCAGIVADPSGHPSHRPITISVGA